MGQSIEVNLLDGLVLLGLKHVQNLVELKLGSSLDQHRLVVKVALGHLGQKLGCRRVEQFLILAHLWAYTIEAVNLLGSQETAHAAIQHLGLDVLGIEVAEHHCRAAVAGPAHHEVDGRRECDKVVGILVGDDGALVHALDDIDARAQRCESHHALRDDLGGDPQVEHHSQAGDGIVHVHGVGHGQCERVSLAAIGIVDDRASVLDGSLLDIQLLGGVGL